MLVKCPDCAKEFSELANICPQCGCPVSFAKATYTEPLVADVAPSVPNRADKSQKKPNRKMFAGLIVVLLLALFTGIGSCASADLDEVFIEDSMVRYDNEEGVLKCTVAVRNGCSSYDLVNAMLKIVLYNKNDEIMDTLKIELPGLSAGNSYIYNEKLDYPNDFESYSASLVFDGENLVSSSEEIVPNFPCYDVTEVEDDGVIVWSGSFGSESDKSEAVSVSLSLWNDGELVYSQWREEFIESGASLDFEFSEEASEVDYDEYTVSVCGI